MGSKAFFFPDDVEVRERQHKWSNFFEKYTALAAAEGDDEGMEMNDLVACMEADESDYENEYLEEEYPDNVEIDVEREEVIDDFEREITKQKMEKERKLSLVPVSNANDNYRALTKFYSPDFIEECKSAFKQRLFEVSQMNLPFWNYSRSYENYNENHVQTPQLMAMSRNYVKASESMQGGLAMPDPRQDWTLHRNNTINGMPIPNATFSFTQPVIPHEIYQFLPQTPTGGRMNVQFREFHYNISFDGTQDFSSIFQPNGSILPNNSFFPGHFNSSSLPFMPTSNSTMLPPPSQSAAPPLPPSSSSSSSSSSRPLLNLPPPPPSAKNSENKSCSSPEKKKKSNRDEAKENKSAAPKTSKAKSSKSSRPLLNLPPPSPIKCQKKNSNEKLPSDEHKYSSPEKKKKLNRDEMKEDSEAALKSAPKSTEPTLVHPPPPPPLKSKGNQPTCEKQNVQNKCLSPERKKESKITVPKISEPAFVQPPPPAKSKENQPLPEKQTVQNKCLSPEKQKESKSTVPKSSEPALVQPLPPAKSKENQPSLEKQTVQNKNASREKKKHKTKKDSKSGESMPSQKQQLQRNEVKEKESKKKAATKSVTERETLHDRPLRRDLVVKHKSEVTHREHHHRSMMEKDNQPQNTSQSDIDAGKKQKRKTKRQLKQIDRRPLSESSSDGEFDFEKYHKPEQTASKKNIKELPKVKVQIRLPTLDEVSCGSSCSTVTSDDDSKFFQAARYNKLREEKKLKHRERKLRNRLRELGIACESPPTVAKSAQPAKDHGGNTKKKTYIISSSCESDDDFFLKAVERQKMLKEANNNPAKENPQPVKGRGGNTKKDTAPPNSSSCESDDNFFLKAVDRQKMLKKKQ